MSQTNTFDFILIEILKLIKPLADASEQGIDGIRGLALDAGLDLDRILNDSSLNNLSNIVSNIKIIYDSLRPIVENGEINESQSLNLLIEVKGLIEVIHSLNNLNLKDGIPILFHKIGNIVINYLIISYLLKYHTGLFCFLSLIGVIDEGKREEQYFPQIVFSNFSKFLNGIDNIFNHIYKWGTNEFNSSLFLIRLHSFLQYIGVPSRLGSIDHNIIVNDLDKNVFTLFQQLIIPIFWIEENENQSEIGLSIMPLGTKNDKLPGLGLIPHGLTSISGNKSLENNWILQLSASTNIGIPWGIILRPGITEITSIDENSASPQNARLAFSITKENGFENNIIVFGNKNSSRLELGSVGLGLDFDFQEDSNISVEFPIKGLKFIIKPSEGDGFIRKVLPENGLEAVFDLVLGISLKKGFYFEGSGGLEVEIPIHKTILNSLTVNSLFLSLKTNSSNNDSPIRCYSAISGSLKLGPFTSIFEKIGLKANVEFPVNNDGNLRFMDLDFGFKPPTGLGISINSAGIKGGGFLSFDPDNHKYTGVFELSIQDVISVKVIGILTTKLPNNMEGYSLLLIVMAEFTPINLGFGFTLNGVGGLVAVHRTVKVDELRKGVKDGSLGSILFPEDPVANAPQIISDLERVFPIQEGRYAFGLMAKIGWGAPTLITLDIGLVIELPTPIRIVILGIIRCSLPHEEFPIIKINANFLGVIDFEKKYITFDASLFDSRIQLFNLSGDMALRIRWGSNPVFLLTVGGFHPAFPIPNNLDLPTLSRLTINLLDGDNPRLTLSSYFAITSNTVQFGAKVDFYFSVSDNIRAIGLLAFDVLIHFSPFHLLATLMSSVSIVYKNKALCAVTFLGQLEGPTPWKINGLAEFEILKISYSIDIEKTFGESQRIIAGPFDVYNEFKLAVQNKSSWKCETASGVNELVTIRDISSDSSELVVSSSGILKISQKVIPLGIILDKFGSNSIASGRTFDMRVAGSSKRCKEMFAAANFFELSDADKLAKPSFEEFDSGLDFSDDKAFDTDQGVEVELEYEQIEIKNIDRSRKPIGTLAFDRDVASFLVRNGSIASSGLSNHVSSLNPMINLEVKKEEYVVSQTDLSSNTPFKGNYYQATKEAMKIVSEDVKMEGKIFINKIAE